MTTILIIVLILFLLPRLLGWWLRWWVGRRLAGAHRRQGARRTSGHKQRREGEISVEGNSVRGCVRGDVGEYVEFEEITEIKGE